MADLWKNFEWRVSENATKRKEGGGGGEEINFREVVQRNSPLKQIYTVFQVTKKQFHRNNFFFSSPSSFFFFFFFFFFCGGERKFVRKLSGKKIESNLH